MKKPSKNRFDLLVDSLSKSFANIPNFNLINTDDNAKRLFVFIVRKFADIKDFKILYKRYYIPSANEAIADTRNEIRFSFYKNIIRYTEIQLKENYYDTIRLGYVGLFHKVENFVKDMLAEANLSFNDGKLDDDSVENFYKLKYNYKFNDWYSDIWLKKINWISNCVKHYDGYPLKEPKFEFLKHLPENEKIKIEKEAFYEDLDYVADKFYIFKAQQIIVLSLSKTFLESKNDEFLNDDIREKNEKLEEMIKNFMI